MLVTSLESQMGPLVSVWHRFLSFLFCIGQNKHVCFVSVLISWQIIIQHINSSCSWPGKKKIRNTRFVAWMFEKSNLNWLDGLKNTWRDKVNHWYHCSHLKSLQRFGLWLHKAFRNLNSAAICTDSLITKICSQTKKLLISANYAGKKVKCQHFDTWLRIDCFHNMKCEDFCSCQLGRRCCTKQYVPLGGGRG